MNHPTKKQLFEMCQNNIPLDVMDVDSLACDNAAATIGSSFIVGEFSEEFINHWFSSVQSILADSDSVTDTARAWFESYNVKY